LGYGRLVSRGLLLLLAFLTAISLASYHPNDPNLLSRGSVGDYHNMCGFVGANLAGLPVAFVGLGAWLLPLYTVWEVLRRGAQAWQKRLAWLVLGLSLWTWLGALGTVSWPPNGGAGAGQVLCGGWMGYVAWPFLRGFLGSIGLPLTLTVLPILSMAVLAPKSAEALWGYMASRLRTATGHLAVGPALSLLSRPAKALFGVAARSFLKMMRAARQQAPVPEIDAMDAQDLQKLDELAQAVTALEKADREATALRRMENQLPAEMDYPVIHSVVVDLSAIPESEPTPIRPISLEQADLELGLPGVLNVTIGPRPAAARPPATPTPPHPRRPPPETAEGPHSQGSKGHTAPNTHHGAFGPPPPQPQAERPAPPGSGRDRFDLPPRRLFDPPSAKSRTDPRQLEATSAAIHQKLAEFKVKGRMTGMQPGPVVTVYEFSPDAGVPISKVMGMEEDLALGLRAEKIRIDRIPGKNVLGIEVPNAERELIGFGELLGSQEFLEPQGGRSFLHLVLGKDMGGRPVVVDLARMPHLLVGGSTGSGKSVGVNAMICSVLLRARADEVKMILVDPKMVELKLYENIPHLWAPVVTDMKKAGRVLKWVVAQMEERYKLLAAMSVRNLEQYNTKVIEAGGRIELSRATPNPDRPQILERLPYIVVVIDELADLMMVCRSEVEESIARIAQKARAVGIHLVLATQRPSVDIVTGVIKANLPARLSYRVNTKIDSRTILDSGGGEQLLGNGDALFKAQDTSRLRRIHAPYVTEDEILRLVEWLKERGCPDYNAALMRAMDTEEAEAGQGGSPAAGGDDIYDRAVAIVARERKASTSLLQRRLNLGYGRAAKLMDRMEDEGVIGPDRGPSRPREVLIGAPVAAE
jgi:S-DNA-T family DNA segregation ATPase FtsK/SpoIIIE